MCSGIWSLEEGIKPIKGIHTGKQHELVRREIQRYKDGGDGTAVLRIQ